MALGKIGDRFRISSSTLEDQHQSKMFEVSAESQPPNESTINVRGHDDINSSRNLYTNVRVAILSGILFLSGIGALIFETLWLRLSGLAFGNSIWAATLILSSFMAGLALGNAIAASSKVRRWRPPAWSRPSEIGRIIPLAMCKGSPQCLSKTSNWEARADQNRLLP